MNKALVIFILVNILSNGACKKKLVFMIEVVQPNAYNEEIGARVAIKHINNNPNLLQGYELELYTVPSIPQTDVYSYRHVFNFLIHVKLKSMNGVTPFFFGPLASSDIEIFREFFPEFSLVQINAHAYSPVIQDRLNFPYVFNTCVNGQTYIEALAEMFLRFDWRRVAIFYFNVFKEEIKLRSRLSVLTEAFFIQRGIEVTVVGALEQMETILKEQDLENWKHVLLAEKKKDVRIFVLYIIPQMHIELLCLIHELGMFGPKYLYFLVHGYELSKWKLRYSKTRNVKCSEDQAMSVLESFVLVQRTEREDNSNLMTALNYTVGQVYNETRETYINSAETNDKVFKNTNLNYYDATVAGALALHEVLKEDPTFVETIDFKRNDTKLKLMKSKLEKLDFQGATRRIKFKNEGRIRKVEKNYVKYFRIKGYTDLLIDNVPNATLARIELLAKYSDFDDHIISDNFADKWPFPVPLDRPKEVRIIEDYGMATIIPLFVLTGSGIVFSLAFLVFNIYYRKSTFIKMSSPNINNLICVGGIVSYSSIVFGGMDTTLIKTSQISMFCDLTTVVLSVGFTLTFGSLVSKTWRIYRIFTKRNSIRSVVIRDFHLFAVVGILLLLDIIIFLTSITVSPNTLHQNIETQLNVTMDVNTKTVIYKCQSDHQTIFYGAIYLYKGLLMAFGLFLAYETRNIRVKSINDSKYIGLAVYNLALFGTLGLIVVTALHETKNFRTSYIIFSACILQTTTVTLYLIFVPKIRKIATNYEDPHFRNGRPVIDGDSSRKSSAWKLSAWKSNSTMKSDLE